MKAKRRKLGLMVAGVALLAMVLIVAFSATAVAGSHYNFDSSKYNTKCFDHRIDWSKVGWCNFDFSKCDMKHFDWSKFDWKKFKWGHHRCTTTTTCEVTTTVEVVTTEEMTTSTDEGGSTTSVQDITSGTTEADTDSTAGAIETGGGGMSGPGAGTWALGFFALALAGGLGWTAVRPALKRK